MEEDELADLARRVAEMITRGLGSRSRWALRAALDAAEYDGVAGVCVLQIPPKSKDFLEVNFTAGTVDVITRWGAA